MDPRTPPTLHLLIDGYLANSFGSRDAEAYYSNLLRRTQILFQAYNFQGYPGICFTASPPGPDPNPRPPQTPWVIDYANGNEGTVIAQQIWVPRVLYYPLCPPIFFVGNGGLGLPLNEAAGGYGIYLRGASQPAPLGANSSTHAQIRIGWRGYPPWDNQIMIRDQAQGRQEIVRLEKFVQHVARTVQKFMGDMENNRVPYNNNGRQWLIGTGGITARDVILVGVVHVSQGSWMPILRLNRFVL